LEADTLWIVGCGGERAERRATLRAEEEWRRVSVNIIIKLALKKAIVWRVDIPAIVVIIMEVTDTPPLARLVAIAPSRNSIDKLLSNNDFTELISEVVFWSFAPLSPALW
jgi:hypothetical protein